MIKALLKYLLSACILLSGHSVLRAHASSPCPHYSSLQSAASPANTCVGTIENSLALVSMLVSPAPEKENDGLNALFVDDDNDDELTSFKKHPLSQHNAASISVAPTPGCFFSKDKNTLLFPTAFSHTSSHRYLLCRVFRI